VNTTHTQLQRVLCESDPWDEFGDEVLRLSRLEMSMTCWPIGMWDWCVLFLVWYPIFNIRFAYNKTSKTVVHTIPLLNLSNQYLHPLVCHPSTFPLHGERLAVIAYRHPSASRRQVRHQGLPIKKTKRIFHPDNSILGQNVFRQKHRDWIFFVETTTAILRNWS
jgi:hypothetical protein